MITIPPLSLIIAIACALAVGLVLGVFVGSVVAAFLIRVSKSRIEARAVSLMAKIMREAHASGIPFPLAVDAGEAMFKRVAEAERKAVQDQLTKLRRQ